MRAKRDRSPESVFSLTLDSLGWHKGGVRRLVAITSGDEIQRPLGLPALGAFCFAAVTSRVLLPRLRELVGKDWKFGDKEFRESRVEFLVDRDRQIASGPIDLSDLPTRT